MSQAVPISICIPQYNRSKHLLRVLESIRVQEDQDVEVVVSDDCSTDDSAIVIPRYIKSVAQEFPGKIKYIRQLENIGYDRNLRAAMAGGSGEYLLILGNDDALCGRRALVQLMHTLGRLGNPDLAFCNFRETSEEGPLVVRASKTMVLGAGVKVAVQKFRSFSFVGGIVFKRSAFVAHDTDSCDQSVYYQIYLAARTIAAGGIVASIAEPIVVKDIQVDGKSANSYLDVLVQDNLRLMPKTGGLDEVGRVACEAMLPIEVPSRRGLRCFQIYWQIYSFSYPFWLLNYRQNGAYRAALNLAYGCQPSILLRAVACPGWVKFALWGVYLLSSAGGMLTPVTLLRRIAQIIKRWQLAR